MKLEASVDGRTAWLTIEGARFEYQREGGSAIQCGFSLEAVEPGVYSVLIEGRSYEVVAVSGAEVSVNGRSFSVEIFDPRQLRARKNASAGEGRQNIAAQMPGKVVRLLASPGDMVETGQDLVVVEAMKMQNEMKLPKAGRVAEVRTAIDATVAAGEVLVVIE